MFNTFCIETGTWFDGHVVQAKKPKWLRLCLIFNIIFESNVGIKNFWYEFVKHI